MGTNYYRIPKASEMTKREQKLQERLRYDMNLYDPAQANREFRIIEDPNDKWTNLNPWEEFIDGVNVHLGKRSGGWKFLWNWNEEEYYKTKAELFEFIRSGKIVNEYGEQLDPEEFIQMATEWGQPDGWDSDSYYKENPTHRVSWINYEDHEKEIEGLRVCTSTNFS